jgi:hypothetical protein
MNARDALSENLLIVGGEQSRVFDFVNQVIRYDDLCLHQKIDFSYFADKEKVNMPEIINSPKPLLSFALHGTVSPGRPFILDYSEAIMRFYSSYLLGSFGLHPIVSTYQCMVYRGFICLADGRGFRGTFLAYHDPAYPGDVHVKRDSMKAFALPPEFTPDTYHLEAEDERLWV